jgi:hypothetical protein
MLTKTAPGTALTTWANPGGELDAEALTATRSTAVMVEQALRETLGMLYGQKPMALTTYRVLTAVAAIQVKTVHFSQLPLLEGCQPLWHRVARGAERPCRLPVNVFLVGSVFLKTHW